MVHFLNGPHETLTAEMNETRELFNIYIGQSISRPAHCILRYRGKQVEVTVERMS